MVRTGAPMRLSGPLRQGRSVSHVKMLALMASLVAPCPLHRHVVVKSVWTTPLSSPVLNQDLGPESVHSGLLVLSPELPFEATCTSSLHPRLT